MTCVLQPAATACHTCRLPSSPLRTQEEGVCLLTTILHLAPIQTCRGRRQAAWSTLPVEWHPFGWPNRRALKQFTCFDWRGVLVDSSHFGRQSAGQEQGLTTHHLRCQLRVAGRSDGGRIGGVLTQPPSHSIPISTFFDI